MQEAAEALSWCLFNSEMKYGRDQEKLCHDRHVDKGSECSNNVSAMFSQHSVGLLLGDLHLLEHAKVNTGSFEESYLNDQFNILLGNDHLGQLSLSGNLLSSFLSLFVPDCLQGVFQVLPS